MQIVLLFITIVAVCVACTSVFFIVAKAYHCSRYNRNSVAQSVDAIRGITRSWHIGAELTLLVLSVAWLVAYFLNT